MAGTEWVLSTCTYTIPRYHLLGNHNVGGLLTVCGPWFLCYLWDAWQPLHKYCIFTSETIKAQITLKYFTPIKFLNEVCGTHLTSTLYATRALTHIVLCVENRATTHAVCDICLHLYITLDVNDLQTPLRESTNLRHTPLVHTILELIVFHNNTL